MNTEDYLVTTAPDSMGKTTESHPSYGVIGVSRVSGRQSLFDSDVEHGHFIEIRIKEARKIRTGFTHEHIHGGRELISIRMTHAQFAQFITSQNVGDGVACTINYCVSDKDEPWVTKWGGRPEPPMPKPFIDKFHAVGKERAQRILDNIDSASEGINRLLNGTDKPTKANLGAAAAAMASARQDVKSNLPYLMECMDEEMEHKLANAVAEFESYVAGSLQEKGLEVMRDNTMKLALGEPKAISAGGE